MYFARQGDDEGSQDQDMLFVGVDVSKATLDVALNDKQGSEQFSNDEAGIAALRARLRDLPVRWC